MQIQLPPTSDKRSGIYVIENCETGERYYGSTVSFYDRMRSHKSLLQRGEHHNEFLQSDYTEGYAFTCDIIEEMSGATTTELLARERFHISKDPKAYNIVEGVRVSSKQRKGRTGPRKGWSTLTDDQVQRIFLNHEPVSVLCKEFNCSHTLISLVRSGKRCRPQLMKLGLIK